MRHTLYLLLASFSFTLQALDFHARFESLEHTQVGEQIKMLSARQQLRLPNGLAVSFGDLIAMGDFYGIVGAPISAGESAAERRERFVEAYNSLATARESVDEAKKIIQAIHTDVPKADRGVQWNCLTGGACSGFAWWLTPGRYLLLAKQDFDHFGDNAVLAYVAGHEAALQEAQQAGRSKDSKRLDNAYAMEAFATHFLSDRFASGHIRAPRVELPATVTPSVVGSLLVIFMHDEENSAGLHVHNARGDKWMAYGDGSYLEAKNQTNRLMMQNAIQTSVDEISDAYANGRVAMTHPQLGLIPYADENADQGQTDIAPLFYWDANAGQVMRRVSLADPYDRHWTSDWVGWSTLAALKLIH